MKRRKNLWMKFLLKQYQEGRARILKATPSPYITYYPVVKNRPNRLTIRWYTGRRRIVPETQVKTTYLWNRVLLRIEDSYCIAN
ncbi:hypothetical protein MKW98_022278 [Papaver atlanticum]|uniref:Uncharacterized protein n=1 Tax=Papaver atlanticum TaxID=357466 RepID=A0AAD4T3Y6_9MAGN|nr:hypothetical protein MKW98_022278 [Papaver atlanticum]